MAASMTTPDYSSVGADTFGERLLVAHTHMLTKQTLMPRVMHMPSKEAAITIVNLAHDVHGAELNNKTLGLETKKLEATIASKDDRKWLHPTTKKANKDCTDAIGNLDRLNETKPDVHGEVEREEEGPPRCGTVRAR